MKAKDSLVLCIQHLTGWGHERRIAMNGGEGVIDRWMRIRLVMGRRANLDCEGEVGRESYVLCENPGDLDNTMEFWRDSQLKINN